MGMALEAPAWPAITPAEAGAVLARFPASAGRLHPCLAFTPALLCRRAVEVPEGTFFLKRHHARLRSPATLAPEHAFMAHLHAHGLPVPLVETTHDGASVLAQGDWTYELLRPVPGADLYRDRQSWTPFLKACHAHAAGAALARLHLAARDFRAPARPDCPLVGSFTILPAPDPMAAARAYVAARPALAGWLEDKGWQSRLSALSRHWARGWRNLRPCKPVAAPLVDPQRLAPVQPALGRRQHGSRDHRFRPRHANERAARSGHGHGALRSLARSGLRRSGGLRAGRAGPDRGVSQPCPAFRGIWHA
jgi:hypothetical protein